MARPFAAVAVEDATAARWGRAVAKKTIVLWYVLAAEVSAASGDSNCHLPHCPPSPTKLPLRRRMLLTCRR